MSHKAYFTCVKPNSATQSKKGGWGGFWLKLYKLLYSMLCHDIKDPQEKMS